MLSLEFGLCRLASHMHMQYLDYMVLVLNVLEYEIVGVCVIVKIRGKVLLYSSLFRTFSVSEGRRASCVAMRRRGHVGREMMKLVVRVRPITVPHAFRVPIIPRRTLANTW